MQFARLCENVINRPDLAADPRFVLNCNRVANRDVLIPELATAFRKRNTTKWIQDLRAAGVPSGKVRSVPEVFSAKDTLGRGLVLDVPDENHGTVQLVRSPLRFSDTPLRPPLAPPRLGADTEAVLAILRD